LFIIDGGGKIRLTKRRPKNWEKLEIGDDFHFIPENRDWDADEIELVSKAIGLYDISTDAARLSGDRWLKRRAREFCRTGRLTLLADPC
jgi:hypothetical protein